MSEQTVLPFISSDEEMGAALNALAETEKSIRDYRLYLQANQTEQQRFSSAIDLIFNSDQVVLSGLGKSYKIAAKAAATFKSTGTPALEMHPGDALHGDLGDMQVFQSEKKQQKKSVVAFLISQSGKTAEVLQVAYYCKANHIPIISLTGTDENPLAELADVPLQNRVLVETACPLESAPMNSTSTTLAITDALAVGLMIRSGFQKKNFLDTHAGGNLGARLKPVEEVMSTGDEIPVVSTQMTLSDAHTVLKTKKQGCVLIVNNDSLVGIVTESDMLSSLMKGNNNSNTCIEQVMTPKPKQMPIGQTVGEAEDLMKELGIRHLPIVGKKGELVGLYTFHSK